MKDFEIAAINAATTFEETEILFVLESVEINS